MKTIKQRNEEAFSKMKEQHLQNLAKDSMMTVGDVVEFGQAVYRLSTKIQPTLADERQMMYHLLCHVDTQENGIGVQPRYKLILQYEWAMRNCIRDWNTRYEMGK